MGIADLFRADYKSSNPETRLKAVTKLTDEAILDELARCDVSPRVRLAATEKIQDQNHLLNIALHGNEIDARIAAVERIESQQVLADIIKQRKNLKLMGACFARITDRSILDAIANDTEYNLTARRMAIENYADESFLEDLQPKHDTGSPAKTPEEIEELIQRYGGVRLARALGKFRGSPNAMIALGEILKRGGEMAEVAVDQLANGLIHANRTVRNAAFKQLVSLKDGDLINHLIRLMDHAQLHAAILDVLNHIDHPEARRAVENE